MKRLLALAVLLVAGLVLADVRWRNGNTTDLGTVITVNCVKDGGLLCGRDAGSIGDIRCMAGSATETGCVTLGAQTFAGDKTFTGTVKAVVLDGGVGAIGSLDMRGNTLTGLATGSTLTIQSNTSDGTTSSTVAATTFVCGSNVASTDLCWSWKDSSGTTQMAVTEQGVLYCDTIAIQTSATAIDGLDFSGTSGEGGIAGGGSPGGIGGDVTWLAANGGASDGTSVGGSGGGVLVRSGHGGVGSGSAVGGAGGLTALASGSGGIGAAGGDISIAAGAGGSATAAVGNERGGRITITPGAGGNAAAGGTTADVGGDLTIKSGAGGTSTVGETSGAGGLLTIQSGTAGATTGGTGASAGAVVIDTGGSTGAAALATISIGATNGGTVNVSRSGQTTAVAGNATVAGTLALGASGTAIVRHLSAAASLDFTALAANTCEVLTIAVANAADGDTCFLGVPTALADVDGATERTTFFCWVSSAGVVSVRRCNVTGSATAEPAAATVRADVWQH